MINEFRSKLQKLTYLDFQGHDRHDWLTMDLSEEELLSELQRMPAPDLFLGRYTVDDIRERLSSRNIFRKLAEAGFPEAEVEVSTDRVYSHRMYVHTGIRDYDHILIELRLREGVFQPKQIFVPGVAFGPLSMIMVDFLLLQNPRASFGDDRPALPQQTYPGLGILKDLIPLVIEVVGESGRAGVLDVPEHYHGALFYSKWFKFLNPEMQGKFLAMKRDLKDHPLHLASICVFNDCLVNETTREIEKWSPGEQILPTCDLLLDYFDHPVYAEIRDRAMNDNRYSLDFARFEEKKKKGEIIDGIARDNRPRAVPGERP